MGWVAMVTCTSLVACGLHKLWDPQMDDPRNIMSPLVVYSLWVGLHITVCVLPHNMHSDFCEALFFVIMCGVRLADHNHSVAGSGEGGGLRHGGFPCKIALTPIFKTQNSVEDSRKAFRGLFSSHIRLALQLFYCLYTPVSKAYCVRGGMGVAHVLGSAKVAADCWG